MPSVTISGAGASATAIFDTDEAYSYAETLATQIDAGLASGSLTPVFYTSGQIAPVPADGASGVVVFNTTPTTPVFINGADPYVFITGGPTSIQGGAAGGTVIAGSSGLTYTNITPSGNAVDNIVAGGGNNLIQTSTFGAGNYEISTGAGHDIINVLDGGTSTISAGTGTNAINVSDGVATIYADGYDTISGSTTAGGGSLTVYIGADKVDSGGGSTTINPNFDDLHVQGANDSTAPLFVNLGFGSVSAFVGAGGGIVHGGLDGENFMVAGLIAPNGAAATLYGGGDGDRLYATGNVPVTMIAGAGSELLSAGGPMSDDGVYLASTANNIFEAGSGTAEMIGGLGNDTYYVNSGADTVTEATNAGVDTVHATISYTLTANVENLILDGTGAIDGTGNALDNVLTGNSGANVLHGQDGNDAISGGGGADTIYGDDGNDVLFGNGGADTIYGGDGNDTIDGGLNNDIMDGGTGVNTASYASAPAAVTVNLALQGQAQDTIGAGVDTLTNFQNLTGSAFNDTLTGDGNANVINGGSGDDVVMAGAGADTVNGGPGNDTIYGNGGADVLNGNGGNDKLVGGAGADTLTGGAGNDTFVYTLVTDCTPAAPDLITDFVHGTDKIDLTALHLASASDVRIVSNGGLTHLYIDANNDGSSDMLINLTGANVLTASDIVGLPAASPAAHAATTDAISAAAAHHDFSAGLHAAAIDHGLYG